jgi:hypothetical protein
VKWHLTLPCSICWQVQVPKQGACEKWGEDPTSGRALLALAPAASPLLSSSETWQPQMISGASTGTYHILGACRSQTSSQPSVFLHFTRSAVGSGPCTHISLPLSLPSTSRECSKASGACNS